ncbi:MAG: hypothetical protein QM483_03370 [Desulfuromusa sp.]
MQQLLETRFSALSAGNYVALYDSYHDDAPLRQQFSDRSSYIQFAQQQLGSIAIINWRCLRQRVLDEKQIEVLLVMEIVAAVSSRFFYELALLIKTATGWRYHSAQKLGIEDYPGVPEKIDFHHFDNVDQKICF